MGFAVVLDACVLYPLPLRDTLLRLAAVAEAILSSEDRPLRATQLAQQAGWSVPQVANVLTAFDKQGWTVKRGTARGPQAHRDLVDGDAMLAAWSEAVTTKPRPTRNRASRRTRCDAPAPRGPRPRAEPQRRMGTQWMGRARADGTTASLHIYVAEKRFRWRADRGARTGRPTRGLTKAGV